MGVYRDESGLVFEADPKYADAMGYTPVSPAEENDIYNQRGLAARTEEDKANSGFEGGLAAAGNRFASGATLGLSDMATAAILPDEYRKRLVGDIAAHPYIGAASEFAGSIAPALVAPESALGRTPTGYLANLASHEVESGLARGGVAGVSKALGVMGTEGALMSGGQYIGHAALEDADVTAEGLTGALGTGFAFGALGGGAALGVGRGVMAARKLFARTMDGGDASLVESAWTNAKEEALQADTITAQTAQARLDEIRKAKSEALRFHNETRAATRDEQLRAQAAGPVPNEGMPVPDTGIEGPAPLDAGIAPAQNGTPTSVFTRPDALDPAAAQAFDASLPTPNEGPAPLADASLMAKPSSGQVTAIRPPTTKVIPRPEGVAAASDLEGQLAGTKAKLDAGESLAEVSAQAERPIKASKGNESDSIEKWLAEARDHSQAKKSADLAGLREQGLRRSSDDLLETMRHARTEALLGKDIANTESDLESALTEFTAARKDFVDLQNKAAVPDRFFLKPGEPRPLEPGDLEKIRSTQGTAVGKRKAIEAVDTAHEEALMHAQQANDPAAAGAALHDADQLEKMLEHLTHSGVQSELALAPGIGTLESPVPPDFLTEVAGGAKIINRYEKASAHLADTVGEGAHPVSAAKAKAYSQANDDAVRKATDRSTRALEDHGSEQYGPAEKPAGPEYKTPKERVLYAKGRQNEAAKNYEAVSADMIDAQDAAAKAKAQVRTGEQAKKAALRADAKAAKPSAASKAANFGLNLAGVDELLDIKGMPKASDLPVVGPLLGLWLKYRTLKGALGRAMGKIPATADNRVAALASRTRDRIARAVDRSLGAMDGTGKYAARVVPPAAGMLAARIYDDGLPSPKKDAPIGEHAAARVRELANYVNTPDAIEKDVRRQLADVVDPDIIAAAEKQRRMAMQYLLDNAPKMPEQGIIPTIKAQPSAAESMAFARRWAAVNDPAAVYEQLAAKQAMLSLEAADALQNVYPQLFVQAQQRVLEKIGEANGTIPYRTRLQMTLLYKLPLDAALTADNLKISQSVYERKPIVPPSGPPAPPAPSISGNTNLTALFQTTADRRAMR